ncbi:hypothetical protein ScPMuIL_016129 [Solemya velum]
MGQANSFPDPAYVSVIHGKLHTQACIIKKLATLTYPQFLESIKELNTITRGFTDQHDKQLHFVLVPNTDATLLWKGTVRIKCEKILVSSGTVESSRVLNLRQYVIMYREIGEQLMTLSGLQTSASRTRDLCASVIMDEMDKVLPTRCDESECCICMDNESRIILPCAHRFCEGCIDTWNVSHRTCPLCRAQVSSTDDTWVLTEKPDSSEYASEVKGYLVGLADRGKNGQ